MRALGKLSKGILWTGGIAVIFVLALPLWVDPVVKMVVNAIVPAKIGTGFSLDEFAMNPYSGRLTVRGVRLANPDGFKQKAAATLGMLHIDVDMRTVMSEVIIVEDVVLTDLIVSCVLNDRGEDNFEIIRRNATGGRPNAKSVPSDEQLEAAVRQDSDRNPDRKIVIDHLLVKNVLVQLGPVSFPFSMELNGIGRKSSGATLQEVWNEIYAQFLRKLGTLGANVGGLVGALGDLGNEYALKALEAAEGGDVSGVADALKGGAGFAGDAAGEGADKAVKAFKRIFK